MRFKCVYSTFYCPFQKIENTNFPNYKFMGLVESRIWMPTFFGNGEKCLNIICMGLIKVLDFSVLER